MGIVKYFKDEVGRGKFFDAQKALEDGGWFNSNRLTTEDLHGVNVVDRTDPENTATIDRIEHERYFNMYVVFFESGGYLFLDHAIEQYRIKQEN